MDTSAYWSTIGGGAFNFVRSYWSTIGGGELNLIDLAAPASFIGGGQINKAFANYSTIGGGFYNLIGRQTVSWCDLTWQEPTGTIAGGGEDTIGPLDTRWVANDSLLLPPNYSSPVMASIGGGKKNTVNGTYGTVGGGFINHAIGMGATVPGGIGLITIDCQTAVGRYNKNATYNLGYLLGAEPNSIPNRGDAITFMVGNGTDTAHRSNAFTVADVGYSTAYDNIGSGGAVLASTPAQSRIGTTYASNTMVAWGDVAASQNNTLDDIGVGTVLWGGTNSGMYTITLNVVNQDGSAHTFTTNDAAITVSLGPGPAAAAGMITVTPLNAGPPATFIVKTFDATGHHSDGYGFQFHVVAR